MSGGTHLRLEERERLAALKAEGLSLRAIAARLGRAASTISRELRRNALPKGGYLPVHAEGCYLERRQRPAALERDTKLGRFVRERLLEGWTPEPGPAPAGVEHRPGPSADQEVTFPVPGVLALLDVLGPVVDRAPLGDGGARLTARRRPRLARPRGSSFQSFSAFCPGRWRKA